MKKIQFKDNEYNPKEFIYFVDNMDWEEYTQEEIDEAEDLIPLYKTVRTGTTWNGDDEYFPSIDYVITDPEYLNGTEIDEAQEFLRKG